MCQSIRRTLKSTADKDKEASEPDGLPSPEFVSNKNRQYCPQNTPNIVGGNNLALNSSIWVVEGLLEECVPENTAEYSLIETKKQESSATGDGDTNGKSSSFEFGEPHDEQCKRKKYVEKDNLIEEDLRKSATMSLLWNILLSEVLLPTSFISTRIISSTHAKPTLECKKTTIKRSGPITFIGSSVGHDKLASYPKPWPQIRGRGIPQMLTKGSTSM